MSLSSKKLKKKRPNFLRQDAHKLHLPKNWRRPRGIHNKMRLGKKGHRVKPDSGYRSPKSVRYKHFSNLNQIPVKNMKSLENIDYMKDIAILAKGLGLKKRVQMVEICIQKKIRILNIRDPNKFLEEAKKSREKTKEEHMSKKEIREKTKEDLLKKSEEKSKEEKKDDKEEKKQVEKKILEQEILQKKQPDIPHQRISDKSAKTDIVRTKIPSGGDRGI